MRVSLVVSILALMYCASGFAAGILTISGQIDGSDSVQIGSSSASWTHTQWDQPSGVVINGVAWNTVTQPTIVLTGPLIPSDLLNYLVTTTVLSGRDVAVARPDSGGVLLQFSDTPNGPDNYAVQVSFTPKPAPAASPSAILHIAGNIDGSDMVQITASGATWVHQQWASPTSVILNGIPWDTVAEPTIANSGATAFLPAGIDFSTAILTESSGRDVASYEAFSDHVDVIFADNPVGAGFADVTLVFGSVPEPATLGLFGIGACMLLNRRRLTA